MYIYLSMVFSHSQPRNLGLDDNLESSPAVHLIQSSLIVVELEYIGYHALDVDLSTVEVSNGAWKAEGLRE
jgi:hypothetical protein